MSDNTIYAIYEDRYHRLWLPSNYGLMSFHYPTNKIQIYHTKDGIADEEFNSLASYRAPDGRLFLGGLNGITAFYPDQIQSSDMSMATLLVTQFQKFDTETGQMRDHLADYQSHNKIQLTADDRLFRLSFGLLDYRYLGQTRIWYRIRGWQEKWALHDQLSLQLNGLPSGDYTLDVRAQTPNGNWISGVLAIPISIDKPVYLQTWFLGLVLLSIVLLLRAYFRYRNRQILAANAHLEAEVARRTAQIEQDKAIIEQQATDLQANATLKARFFANVSHEFRTPLTLLIGPIRHLANLVHDTQARQLLAAMERNTHQLLQLVNDVLDLGKLDAQQLTLNEQPADLSQVVQNVLAHFRPQAHYTGIHLHLSGDNTPLLMRLDVPRLETVLRNILSNAVRYTSPGGTITVAISQTPDDALISVTDTGQGIHPDDLPRIFDRYFQTKQTNKPVQGGTGIGLALCREYCQLWQGTLSVVSTLGKGSTFTVSYPVKTAHVVSIHRAETPPLPVQLPPEQPFVQPLPNSESSSIRLLVVEDNPDMLGYICTVLASHYTLQTARNGRDALELLTSAATDTLPHLILSDVMMPEMDGLELVTAIRQQPSLKAIPVVLLTARADLETRLHALQLGVADYLTKPFHEAELLVRIENLLARAEEQVIWQAESSADERDVSSVSDQDWIEYLQGLIRDNRSRLDFTVQLLADMAHISERGLYRRVKALTGLSPNQLIQEVRLQVAYELLQQQPAPSVKSVVYQVGYQNLSYFSRLYRARFGVNPGKQQQSELEQSLSSSAHPVQSQT